MLGAGCYRTRIAFEYSIKECSAKTIFCAAFRIFYRTAFWQPARKGGAAGTMEESSGNICRTESAISEIKASMHGESFCRFHPLPDRNMILQRIDSKARQNRDEPILSTKTLKDFEFPVKEPALNAPMYKSTTAKDNPSLQSLPDSINKQTKSATSNSEENPPVSVKKKRKCFSWLFS